MRLPYLTWVSKLVLLIKREHGFSYGDTRLGQGKEECKALPEGNIEIREDIEKRCEFISVEKKIPLLRKQKRKSPRKKTQESSKLGLPLVI